MFVLGLALTTGGVGPARPPTASRPVELLVLVGANALATAAALRRLPFLDLRRSPYVLGAHGMSKPANIAAPIPTSPSGEHAA